MLARIILLVALCLVNLTPAVAQWDTQIDVVAPEEAFGARPAPSLLLTQTDDPPVWLEEPHSPATQPRANASTEPAGLADMLSPAQLTPTLRTVLLIGMLSLVPAVLVMTTCFARFAIVLGLLRQGLGAQQWLPSQIVLALSLFLTLLVMAPVWTRAYHAGVQPYVDGSYDSADEQRAALQTAFINGVQPVRQFMSAQIGATGNEAAIDMLLAYQQSSSGSDTRPPQFYEDVPLSVLLPAYLLSELKTAFVIGFQIVLPFLVIDLVVASVLTGMGLMMLPPVLVALPFKLLLFVLIDGWTLTVEMLLNSVPPS